MKSYNRISEIQADLQSGVISCLELVEHYLQQIKNGAHLNAFLEVWADEAREAARKTDMEVQSGKMLPLSGLVIAIKDVLAYKNHRVSASSKILEGFESLYTATAVQRLIDAGAIIIGRTNCDEFAMGASNENSAFGPVLNAADHSRVPGGSSGGSAVSVQAGMCHAALGTDTGGSIRQPAAFTGLYGMKPTYGAVSRWGLLAYASSFDQIGTFCKSIEDTRLMFGIMAGPDEYDSTVSVNHKTASFTNEGGKYHFAVMRQATEHEGVNSDVRTITENAIATLEKQGHKISYFDFELLDYMVPAYYVLTTAEASSNLSRYSGLLFGRRSPEARDLESTFVASRSEGFGQEVKRRIMLGTFVLSSDYYDAYYRKAQQVRALIRKKTHEVLDSCDAILIPTTSTAAFKIGEKSQDPIAMYLADLFTVQANLAGVPAISLPYGKNHENLPVGIQLITREFEEQKLFALSETIMSTAQG